MPSLIARLLTVLVCFVGCASTAWGLTAGPLLLNTERGAFRIDAPIEAWIDTDSNADVAQVAASPGLFSQVSPLQRHALEQGQTLWIKLRLERAVHSQAQWSLSIPAPHLDELTLYQKGSDGVWQAQASGQALAQTQWDRPGLYADFQLNVPADSPHLVYLRVRNFKHVSLPMRLAPQPTRDYERTLEATLLGTLLGGMLALTLLSLLRFWEHRNRLDLAAFGYGLTVTLTVAQVNGVLNALVWTRLPAWAYFLSNTMPLFAAGASLLFIRNLHTISTSHHHYDLFLGVAAWMTIASSLCFAVMERSTADAISALMLTFSISVGLGTAVLSWWGKSSIWPLLVTAYVPQYLGMVWVMAEVMGLVPYLWQVRYLATLAVALGLPVMLYALGRVTRARKELTQRAQQRPTQDALTSLLTPDAFNIQLQNAYEMVLSEREPTALALVRVINYPFIRLSLGDVVAEQCLLRAVVKLYRVLRDVDPAGRVGGADFALLLQGVATRQALNERMVQLVASGLNPLPGLDPPVTLQFQVACVLLHENPVVPEEALTKLQTILTEMSEQTRRPIRFLEAVPTLVQE